MTPTPLAALHPRPGTRPPQPASPRTRLRRSVGAVTAALNGPAPRPWAGRRRGSWLPWLLGAWALLPVAAVGTTVLTSADWIFQVLGLALVAGSALTARRPLHGWGLTTAALVALAVLSGPHVGDDLPVWLWLGWWPVLLIAGWSTQGRTSALVWAGSWAATLVVVTVTPWRQPALSLWVPVLLTTVGLAVGWVVRRRQESAAAFAAAIADERRAGQEARDAGIALAERARIAREMHDVVAHHMSLVAVRAETAPYRLPDLDGRAVEELAAVAAAARTAMTELQDLLGVLRSDDVVATRPQPGLADLEPMLTGAAGAGVALTWQVTDVAVPDGVGLTAYRIVSQGLANAAQHAADARVHVSVTATDDTLVVLVENDPGHDRGPGTGAGLLGLAERVRVHGGTFVARATDAGGFTVRAELPLPGSGRG